MTKQKKLRHLEYYGLQETFDNLYAKSKQGEFFNNLMKLISSEENIRLAYRNIKRNAGSITSGVDGKTIKDIEKLSAEKLVETIQNKFRFYKPKPVRRKEIPKPDGKMRPLGIPTIIDRIAQQCILQVLEPICEAKFHERNNGFRPNRSAENALAQCYKMIQVQNLHFVVDIDIKGFFGNVNHSKLIRQIWAMGIHLGYLTYGFYTKEVSIPNYEISEQFASTIKVMGWSEVADSLKSSDELLKATLNCDEEKVAELIDKAHSENTSILKYNDENSLSCVISLAYYSARKTYIIERELPAGKGYADLVFRPRKNNSNPAIIVELKYDKSADGALEQIKKKQYTDCLKDYSGEILLVGINYDKENKSHNCRIEKTVL